MHSFPPALRALRTALGCPLRCAREELPLPRRTATDETGETPQVAAIDRHDPPGRPPFETIRLGPATCDARPHTVTVLNDGPPRTVSIAVEGAGLGEVFDGSRPVAAGGAIRLELRQPDAYEIRVHAPGRPAYTVSVEPAWFERHAGLTSVVVRADGYACSKPV